jgi:para-aminobenzoate synthetase component II
MILLIDNYDSFTYNLVQRLGEIDPSLELEVYRNDQITVDQIEARHPSHLIISPGPCTPNEAGISLAAVAHFAGRLPLLGVCLGHQSIGQAFGAKIVRAGRLMHGKTDMIHHDNCGLYAGLENPFVATRYHSLVIQPDTLSDQFDVCAWSNAPDGTREIMGIRHKRFPLFGVQFHPESFLTPCGTTILERFLQTKMKAEPVRRGEEQGAGK